MGFVRWILDIRQPVHEDDVNLEAELEIVLLHEKIDLLPIQKEQLKVRAAMEEEK